MAEEEANQGYTQDNFNETSLKISELEERMNNLKEKVNLISKNFISIKEEIEEKIENIENKDQETRNKINLLTKELSNVTQESERWIRRDEIVLIERMLKDFQPLEFLRKKDFQDFIMNNNLESKKILEKNKNPKILKKQ